jgi:uncharacterized protein YyaL (SSP411 family)
VAAEVLLRLAAWTGESGYRQRADDYLSSLTELMIKYPQSFGYLLGALDFAISPVREIAIVGDPQQSETQSLLAVVNSRYLPNSVLANASPAHPTAAEVIPLLADRQLKNGQPCAYVCQNFACQAPVIRGDELLPLL